MPRTRVAMCPSCSVPLVSTLVFPKAEFYCLDCGGRFGFLDPRGAEETPELLADMNAREVEFGEIAKDLRVGRLWLSDCEKCAPHAEYHEAHATDEERSAHDAALAALDARKKVTA